MGDSHTCGFPTRPAAGYTEFTRYFFAQQDKEGVIIDERYNQGGRLRTTSFSS